MFYCPSLRSVKTQIPMYLWSLDHSCKDMCNKQRTQFFKFFQGEIHSVMHLFKKMHSG